MCIKLVQERPDATVVSSAGDKVNPWMNEVDLLIETEGSEGLNVLIEFSTTNELEWGDYAQKKVLNAFSLSHQCDVEFEMKLIYLGNEEHSFLDTQDAKRQLVNDNLIEVCALPDNIVSPKEAEWKKRPVTNLEELYEFTSNNILSTV